MLTNPGVWGSPMTSNSGRRGWPGQRPHQSHLLGARGNQMVDEHAARVVRGQYLCDERERRSQGSYVVEWHRRCGCEEECWSGEARRGVRRACTRVTIHGRRGVGGVVVAPAAWAAACRQSVELWTPWSTAPIHARSTRSTPATPSRVRAERLTASGSLIWRSRAEGAEVQVTRGSRRGCRTLTRTGWVGWACSSCSASRSSCSSAPRAGSPSNVSVSMTRRVCPSYARASA